jgi:hypothetical protein
MGLKLGDDPHTKKQRVVLFSSFTGARPKLGGLVMVDLVLLKKRRLVNQN